MANRDESVSVTEFARQVGKSAAWISKKSRDGTIPRDQDGKIPLKAGFAAFEEMQKREQAVQAIRGKPKTDDDSPLSATTTGAMNMTAAMNKARLAKETYQAKLKEIEYRLAKGELVEREKVRKDAQKVASALRENLMSIPIRIAGICEGLPQREIEEVIEDAINEALTEFQKTEFLE